MLTFIFFSFYCLSNYFTIYAHCFVCRLQEGLKDLTETPVERFDAIICTKTHRYVVQKASVRKCSNVQKAALLTCASPYREREGDQECQERKETSVLW